MRAVVVYESMYGNTRAVAEKIAEGLAESMQVELVEATAPRPTDLHTFDLAVLGAPTHAFGMSTSQSRAEAIRRGGVTPASTSGIREWLPNLAADFAGQVAVFDTRMGARRAPGSAARAMARRLRREGLRPMGRRSFLVSSQRGPLKAGELYLARAWGSELAVRVRPASGATGPTRRADTN